MVEWEGIRGLEETKSLVLFYLRIDIEGFFPFGVFFIEIDSDTFLAISENCFAAGLLIAMCAWTDLV